MELNDIMLFLGSGGIVAIITAFITKSIADKEHKGQHIINERKTWRNDIREKLVEIAYSKDVKEIKEFHVFMSVRLNPLDKEDKKILSSIDKLIKFPECEITWRELEKRVAYLLKHDWDRSKKEVIHSFSFFKLIIFVVLLLSFIFFLEDFVNWLNMNQFELKIYIYVLGIFMVSGFMYSIFKKLISCAVCNCAQSNCLFLIKLFNCRIKVSSDDETE